MPLDLYISSLAFSNKLSVEEIIKIAEQNSWALEFSSGLEYREDAEQLYMKAPIKKMPHNYFPAPKTPFVLNLASENLEIRNQSIKHCKKGLLLANKSGSPFFAAHAGFCIDPKPSELGKKIDINNTFKKNLNWDLFFTSLQEILITADNLEVDFLIENNVIALFNIINNENPLLCCESADIIQLFSRIKHKRFGLLLDTAHLKVSCNTLHLNLFDELSKVRSFIRGLHHSDNDGVVDSNNSLSENYWFLPLMKEFQNIPHVLEVRDISIKEIKSQIALLNYPYKSRN